VAPPLPSLKGEGEGSLPPPPPLREGGDDGCSKGKGEIKENGKEDDKKEGGRDCVPCLLVF